MMFAYVSTDRVSEALGVLPDTMTLMGDHEPNAPKGTRSVHWWWTPEFRSDLYADVAAIIGSPQPPDRNAWSPNDVLRVAGLGLVNPLREHLGFGLDLIRAAGQGARELELIIDGRAGLRYVEVLHLAGRLCASSRTYVSYARIGSDGRLVLRRIPLQAVEFLMRSASMALRRVRSARVPLGSREKGGLPRTDVAFFESNEKGWEFSKPISEELLARGIPIVVSSPNRAVVKGRDGQFQSVQPERPRWRDVTTRSVEKEAMSLITTTRTRVIKDDIQRRLVARLIARRAMDFVPLIETAIANARLAVGRLGAKVTVQESHFSPAGRAFLLESQRLGAKTFATQHGLIDASAPERDYLVSPDILLEWGHLDSPFPSDSMRVVVVGNPNLEERLNRVWAMRSANTDGRMVLVAFGRPGRIVDPDFFASAIRMVARASTALPDVEFKVKVHPGDRRAFWNAALRDHPDGHSLEFSDSSIEELLGAATVLVTTHSTAGAEAILSGVPVLSVGSHVDPADGRQHQTYYEPPYLSLGAAARIDSDRQLADEIRTLVAEGVPDERVRAMEAFSREFLDRQHGRTSIERTVDAVLAEVDPG